MRTIWTACCHRSKALMNSFGWTFIRNGRRPSTSSMKMPPLRRMTWTGKAATLSDKSFTQR